MEEIRCKYEDKLFPETDFAPDGEHLNLPPDVPRHFRSGDKVPTAINHAPDAEPA